MSTLRLAGGQLKCSFGLLFGELRVEKRRLIRICKYCLRREQLSGARRKLQGTSASGFRDEESSELRAKSWRDFVATSEQNLSSF